MHLARRHAAGAVALELPHAHPVDDGFGHDRTGGIAGTQKEYVQADVVPVILFLPYWYKRCGLSSYPGAAEFRLPLTAILGEIVEQLAHASTWGTGSRT